MQHSRIILALLFALAAGKAFAAGYDYFADGLSAMNRGDCDSAVKDFSSALAAGDLSPRLIPVAHMELGIAHFGEGMCDSALSDLKAAIAGGYNSPRAYFELGNIELCVGDAAAAYSHFTKSIALQPSAVAFFGRGRASWSEGEFEKAAEDVARASSLEPGWSYPLLWFEISRERIGNLDAAEMQRNLDDIELSEWPGPLFKFFRGDISSEDVFRTAADDDPERAKAKLCEANFYIAEWEIAQHKTDASEQLLRSAAANCPVAFVERFAARDELKRPR